MIYNEKIIKDICNNHNSSFTLLKERRDYCKNGLDQIEQQYEDLKDNGKYIPEDLLKQIYKRMKNKK
jgi:hypothetical protein